MTFILVVQQTTGVFGPRQPGTRTRASDLPSSTLFLSGLARPPKSALHLFSKGRKSTSTTELSRHYIFMYMYYYMKWNRVSLWKKRFNRVKGRAFLARKAVASKVTQTFELWIDFIQEMTWVNSSSCGDHHCMHVIPSQSKSSSPKCWTDIHHFLNHGWSYKTSEIVTSEYVLWLFGLLFTYRELTV